MLANGAEIQSAIASLTHIHVEESRSHEQTHDRRANARLDGPILIDCVTQELAIATREQNIPLIPRAWIAFGVQRSPASAVQAGDDVVSASVVMALRAASKPLLRHSLIIASNPNSRAQYRWEPEAGEALLNETESTIRSRYSGESDQDRLQGAMVTLEPMPCALLKPPKITVAVDNLRST